MLSWRHPRCRRHGIVFRSLGSAMYEGLTPCLGAPPPSLTDPPLPNLCTVLNAPRSPRRTLETAPGTAHQEQQDSRRKVFDTPGAQYGCPARCFGVPLSMRRAPLLFFFSLTMPASEPIRTQPAGIVFPELPNCRAGCSVPFHFPIVNLNRRCTHAFVLIGRHDLPFIAPQPAGKWGSIWLSTFV